MALVGSQPSDFTITLGDLADGSAWSSAAVSNTANGYKEAIISVEITSHASNAPDVGSTFDVYLLQSDDDMSDAIMDDNWAGTDASITLLNAQFLGSIEVTADANTEFRGIFHSRDAVEALGPEWGIAILNNTGEAIHTTDANSFARYRYVIPDIAG